MVLHDLSHCRTYPVTLLLKLVLLSQVAGSGSLLYLQFHAFELLFLCTYLLADDGMYIIGQVQEFIFGILHFAYKKFGCCSWCFYTGVCHHIQYGNIALMSDTGYHRKWKLRTVQCQVICVEAGQIGCGSTTTDDYHHIE